jgi:hypothetical protein
MTARHDIRPDMSRALRIVGSYISPYVRKVLVALDLKGLAYETDPLVPFLGDDRFTAESFAGDRARSGVMPV